jgi:hypothetical protein
MTCHGQLPPFDGEADLLLPDDEGAGLVLVLGTPEDGAAGVLVLFGIELEAPPVDEPDDALAPVADELPVDPELLEPPDELLLVLFAAASATSTALPRRDGSRSIRSSEHSTFEPSERSA